MTTRRALLAGLLALGLLTAACGDDTDIRTGDATTTTTGRDGGGVPDRPADISGTVTAVAPFEPITEDCTPPEDLDPDGAISSDDPPVCTDEDSDILGTLLVEERPGVQEGRKISFTVTTATVLSGPGVSRFDDLAEGQTVDAWSTGQCAESYPEQCTAVAMRSTA